FQMLDLQTELRLAFSRARKAYNELDKVHDISVEDVFIKNMSMIVMEVVESIQMNSRVSSDNFDKVRFAFASCPSSRILQLGNSIAFLLEKLLTDRGVWSNGTTSIYGLLQKEKKPAGSVRVIETTSHVNATSGRAPKNGIKRKATSVPEGPPLFNNTMEHDIKMEPEDFEDVPSSSRVQPLLEVRNVPLDEVIKEEVDVKMEPLDEDIKQEPIEDVFLPNSGTSRPVDKSYVRKKKKTTSDDDSVPGCSKPTSKVFLPNSGPFRPVDQTTLSKLDQADSVPRSSKAAKTKPTLERCYLCGCLTDKFACVPPEAEKRDATIRRVIHLTLEHIEKLEALSSVDKTVYFCNMHLTKLDVPSKGPIDFADLKLRCVDAHRFLNKKRAPKTGTVQVNDHRYKLYKCGLCGDQSPAYSNTVSPQYPSAAKAFFSKLVNVTQKQAELIQFFLDNNIRADICMKHIVKHKHYPMGSGARKAPTLTPQTVKTNPVGAVDDIQLSGHGQSKAKSEYSEVKDEV
ncbi:hypothetical protein PMAYCL1PPCAC_04705, partial [Pristionchus mayeri]